MFVALERIEKRSLFNGPHQLISFLFAQRTKFPRKISRTIVIFFLMSRFNVICSDSAVAEAIMEWSVHNSYCQLLALIHPFTSFSFDENPFFFFKIVAMFCYSTFSCLWVMFWQWNAENEIFSNVNFVSLSVLFDF